MARRRLAGGVGVIVGWVEGRGVERGREGGAEERRGMERGSVACAGATRVRSVSSIALGLFFVAEA